MDMYCQLNPFITDTVGTRKSVRIIGVFLLSGLILRECIGWDQEKCA